MNEELYSLFVTGDDTAWESSAAFFDLSRCIREYTDKDLVEQYSNLSKESIEELKKFPCIFAYEDYCEKPAGVGFIKDITVRQLGVKVFFEKIKEIPHETLHSLQFELDIRGWELNRTHWAIKRANLYTELQQVGIDLNYLAINHPIDITKHYFDVSFTFAGESRSIVEQVVIELSKLIDKNRIFYDNNFISQLARPSLDILLQDIYRNRSKLVVVFLCEKYQEKAWCGLEFRVIRELIMEKEESKIMYIRLDAGHVDGVFRTDGYIDGAKFSAQQLAYFIQERLSLM